MGNHDLFLLKLSFSHLKVVGRWLFPLGWPWFLGLMLGSWGVVPCLVFVCNIFCNGIVMDGDVMFFYQLPASLSLSLFSVQADFSNFPWFSFLFQHITMNSWRQVQTLQHKSLICIVFELLIWNLRGARYLKKSSANCHSPWPPTGLQPWYPCQSHMIAISTESIAESFNFFLHISRNLGSKKSRNFTRQISPQRNLLNQRVFGKENMFCWWYFLEYIFFPDHGSALSISG